MIRGNLICLECSGDGRKLFCSNICKCIHHGVPGNPSPQADDFVIFMKVWLKVFSNDQPNFPSCSFSCAPRQKEGMRVEASLVLSFLSHESSLRPGLMTLNWYYSLRSLSFLVFSTFNSFVKECLLLCSLYLSLPPCPGWGTVLHKPRSSLCTRSSISDTFSTWLSCKTMYTDPSQHQSSIPIKKCRG